MCPTVEVEILTLQVCLRCPEISRKVLPSRFINRIQALVGVVHSPLEDLRGGDDPIGSMCGRLGVDDQRFDLEKMKKNIHLSNDLCPILLQESIYPSCVKFQNLARSSNLIEIRTTVSQRFGPLSCAVSTWLHDLRQPMRSWASYTLCPVLIWPLITRHVRGFRQQCVVPLR